MNNKQIKKGCAMLNAEERKYLRDLPKRVKELADTPEQKDKLSKNNRLEPLKKACPPVMVFPIGAAKEELFPSKSPIIRNEFFRKLEYDLIRKLDRCQKLGDDLPVADVIKQGNTMIKLTQTLGLAALLAVSATAAEVIKPQNDPFAAATSLMEVWRPGLKPRLSPNREQVRPLLDHPLRDPSICKGPDGWYYLTGTDGTPILPEYGKVDFLNNDGIRIWRSRDLKNWELVTQAFSLHPKNFGPSAAPKKLPDESRLIHHDFWRRRPIAERRADARESRGIYAPRIHFLKDSFYITYSMNGWGGGLLKSESGKPEGPYVDWGRNNLHYRPGPEVNSQLVSRGGAMSLFEDSDGKVYLLYGDGYIARLTDDLRSLAEAPRLLVCENPKKTDKQAADYPLQVGRGGYFLKKIGNRYFLFATDFITRGSESVEDVYVAWSNNVHGPYSERRWSIPYCGPATVFDGPDGQLLATYCGNDAHAAFRDRAGIVPLAMTTTDFPTIFAPEDAFPRKLLRVNTTRYLFHQLPAISQRAMRDCHPCRGPDGAIYYTGSFVYNDTEGKLFIYKSMDMIHWEEIAVWDWERQKKLFAEPYADFPDPKIPKQFFTYMDTEIWYLNDTFYIGYAVYGSKPGKYLLRSVTGKAEGPYELHATNIPDQPSFFQDTDKKIYFASNEMIRRWRDDMLGPENSDPMMKWMPADGTCLIGDCCGSMVKAGPWYVYGTTGWAQEKYFQCGWSMPDSYSWNLSFSKSLKGPWTRERALLYMGHGGLVEDRFGNWWASIFGCERSQNMPWGGQVPGMHPLKMEMVDGVPHFELADKLPDYAAQALKNAK